MNTPAVTLGELAERFGLTLRGDSKRKVSTVGTLAGAGPDAVSFLANPAYRSQLLETKAAVVVLDEAAAGDCPTDCLIGDNPYASYARIAAFVCAGPAEASGVHPTAVVADDAHMGDGVSIGAHVVVGRGARIGDGVIVGPGSSIGDAVTVGAGSRLAANVSLYDGVSVGARCILHSGAVIGADGFGFARDDKRWVKVPQLGGVRLGDDIEVGANSCVDRGAIEDTVVGDGVKLDNFVQIGHNVHVGEHTIMAGYSGIGGSSRVGKRCMIGGVVKIVGHIDICDDTTFLFGSFVLKSVTEPGVYAGSLPVEDYRTWRRNAARFRQLDAMATRLKRVEQALARLESDEDTD